MGRWIPAEEWHRDRRYKYMVGGEAFDWLLLAERLCDEASGYIPQRDLERLLFHGLLPEPLAEDDLRELLGVSKYRAYLNFHYGVVLEEALQLAAEEYARKRHLARGFSDSEELVEEAFLHLYTRTRSDLLSDYRDEAKLGSARSQPDRSRNSPTGSTSAASTTGTPPASPTTLASPYSASKPSGKPPGPPLYRNRRPARAGDIFAR